VPSRDYHEELWAAVPEGAVGPGLQVRRGFLLGLLSPGMRVLDVGCGEGILAGELRRAGADVLAVDVAEEPLRRARLREPGLDARLIDGEGPWDLPDAHFDLLWAGEVIEHVADTAKWLSEARRVLRPRGTLALSTPDNGPLTLVALALSPRARAERLDPRSDHLRFYTRASLAGLIGEFGFEAVRVSAVGGVPGARRTLLASATRSRF